MNKALESLEALKGIELSHIETWEDENRDGEMEWGEYEEYDGTVAELYEEPVKIISKYLKALEVLKRCNDEAPDDNKIFKLYSYDRPSDLGPALHIDYLIIGSACFIITKEEKKALEEALGIK